VILLALSAYVVPAGQVFICTPAAVWDGDGPIWCTEGPRVRIAGIAARETDGSCRRNQPCPNASARQARDHLVRLLGGARGTSRDGHVLVQGRPMRCLSDGSAGGVRTAAWCTGNGFGDLSCAMVRSGYTLAWQRYWRGHRCH
jgi:endonuclease YncB( thermonuclease family)